MQAAETARENVFEQSELRKLILQQMPVSMEGANGIKNFLRTSHRHREMGAHAFGSDQWTKYKEALGYITLLKTYKQDGGSIHWKYILAKLDEYKDFETVISTILLTIRVSNRLLDPNDEFPAEATVQNIEIVGRTLQKYPQNCIIQEEGCALLNKLYRHAWGQPHLAADHDCDHHIKLAVESMWIPDRTVESITAAMQLLLAIHEINKHALAGFVADTSKDIMSTIFDVQYEFPEHTELTMLCRKFSRLLLPTWTAPVAEETAENPGALKIILVCMQENPASRYHLAVLCEQLSLLAVNNSGTLRVTEETMAFVANTIQTKQLGIMVDVYDEREHHLWQFMGAVAHTTDPNHVSNEFLNNFQSWFNVEFLLISLSIHTKTYNHMNSEYDLLVNNTVGIICRMILMLVVRIDRNIDRDRLLTPDGMSTLMNAIDNHRNTSGDVLGAGHLPCIKILAHMFGANDNTVDTHLTISTRQNPVELRRFGYSTNHNTYRRISSLPDFIKLTLEFMIHTTRTYYGMHFTETLERTTGLLATLFCKGELFCVGIWGCCNIIDELFPVIGTYNQMIDDAQTNGLDVQSYTAAIINTVNNVDRMLIAAKQHKRNTTTDHFHENRFVHYLNITQRYRAHGNNFEAAMRM